MHQDVSAGHRLDPFPFRGTDPNLFGIAVILDPSIQLTTTPEFQRQDALRKAREIMDVLSIR